MSNQACSIIRAFERGLLFSFLWGVCATSSICVGVLDMICGSGEGVVILRICVNLW